MNIPIWIKSAYVIYIGIPPFLRLEGKVPPKMKGSRLWLTDFPHNDIIAYTIISGKKKSFWISYYFLLRYGFTRPIYK